MYSITEEQLKAIENMTSSLFMQRHIYDQEQGTDSVVLNLGEAALKTIRTQTT